MSSPTFPRPRIALSPGTLPRREVRPLQHTSALFSHRFLSPLAIAVALLVIAANTTIATPATAEASTDESQPWLTRVVMRLNTDAEWAEVKITNGGSAKAFHVTAKSPNTNVQRSGPGFRIYKPHSASSAEAEAVFGFYTPLGARPEVQLTKRHSGSAEATIYRKNGQTLHEIAYIRNAKTGMWPFRVLLKPNHTVKKNLARAELVGNGLPIELQDNRKLTLAYYYPWFQEKTSHYGPDKPKRPYNTYRQDEVNEMVAIARNYGVDGFIYSWNNRHELPVELLENSARDHDGFYLSSYVESLAAVDDSGNMDVEEFTDILATALERTAHPNFLTKDTRPVLFVWGTWAFSAEEWQTVKSRAEERTGVEGYYIGFFGSWVRSSSYNFDGYHIYLPPDKSSDELRLMNRNLAGISRLPAHVEPDADQKLWAATANPGFNNLQNSSLNKKFIPRDGGTRYDRTWASSLMSEPEWMLITSWNEWLEQTHIAPSNDHDYRTLEQTAEWSKAFKES